MRIGILGPANAGKDTAADILCKHFGLAKVAFADALYREVAEAFEVEQEYLRDRSYKERPSSRLQLRFCIDDGFVDVMRAKGISVLAALSPRVILEWWGTEYRRAQDTLYWVKQVEKIQGNLVVPDVRFENELAIMDMYFTLRRPKFEVLREHESDQLWRRVKGLEVHNVGAIEDLEGALLDVFGSGGALYGIVV